MRVIIIIYDINDIGSGNSKGELLKEKMGEIGYENSFLYEGKEYFLPNNCLMKSKITTARAKEDLLYQANELKIDIQRLFTTEIRNEIAFPGLLYGPLFMKN